MIASANMKFLRKLAGAELYFSHFKISALLSNKRFRPDDGKTVCFADGHFGPFRWLGDTKDHSKW